MQHEKIIAILLLIFTAGFCVLAQNGTWSGKLDVQGIKLTLVLNNIDENSCTFVSLLKKEYIIPVIHYFVTESHSITVQI